MKKIGIYFAFGLFLFCLNLCVYAQNKPIFQVFGTSGNNTKNGVPLQIGMKITENDTLQIQGTYVGLLGSKGEIVELKDKGIYNTNQIQASKFIKLAQKIPNYYHFILVINNILIADSLRTREWGKSKYSITKSATYENGCMEYMIPMPKVITEWSAEHKYKTEYYGDTIGFRWDIRYLSGNDIKYNTIFIYDLKNNLLTKEQTRSWKTLIVLPKNMPKEFIFNVISEERNEFDSDDDLTFSDIPYKFIFSVDLTKNIEDRFGYETLLNSCEKGIKVSKVSPEKSANIAKKLQEICVSADANMNKLIAARYFEEEGLFMDVIAIYEQLTDNIELFIAKTIKEQKENEYWYHPTETEKKHQKLYRDFLEENGFFK